MNDQREISTTIKSTIYQGDKNIDSLVFVIPKVIEDINIADCTILLKYRVPTGKGFVEQLDLYPIPHNEEYLQYRLNLSSKFTRHCGRIELWLSVLNFNSQTLFQTNTLEIDIKQHIRIEDHLPGRKVDQIDQLTMLVQESIANKVDNITYDPDNRTLQLSANGNPIGDPVTLDEFLGSSIDDFFISRNGNLFVIFKDGTSKNLGKVIGPDGKVYVPSIDEKKILTWEIKDEAGEVPDPVDLNPNDEWNKLDGDTADSESDYIWERM